MNTQIAPVGASYRLPTLREIRMLQVGLDCAVLAGRWVLVKLSTGDIYRVREVSRIIADDKIRFKIEGYDWWQWLRVSEITCESFTVAGVDVIPAWLERGEG